MLNLLLIKLTKNKILGKLTFIIIKSYKFFKILKISNLYKKR